MLCRNGAKARLAISSAFSFVSARTICREMPSGGRSASVAAEGRPLRPVRVGQQPDRGDGTSASIGMPSRAHQRAFSGVRVAYQSGSGCWTGWVTTGAESMS